MAQIELLMPKMGESVAEATVINWLKEVGDKIEAEEAIVEIATDKVDSEIPSEFDGILIKKLFDVDEVVKVGQAIAIIETKGSVDSDDLSLESEFSEAVSATDSLMDKAKETVSADVNSETSDRFYSPLVKSMAKKEGVSISELDSISGTGSEGRVTKADMLSYLENRSKQVAKTAPAPQAAKTIAVVAPVSKSPTVSWTGDDEIIVMDRMRKLIADHMVMSKQVSPHVTSFVEADVTRIVNWRNKVKDQFLAREGTKITYTPIFIEAIVKAIKDFPMINISVDGDKIIRRKDINIGMATALPSGNLIVPVIKNADSKNLIGLTKEVNGLAGKARTNKLSPDDISGGTYTVTNVGTFGNISGTPIINQPQVAIMALGAIRKMPAVIETPEGDVIAIRHKMILSHAYDHRVVDGALGGMFVKRVAEYLEAFDSDREF
ncbi:MAG: 2-oxo acid dehydrogenase subunit E2 [Flavobacteriales bacterium]|nr:2-oxo acid dehydrogenase subunit E2 [Flavobacteriales bacterium]